LSLLFTIIHGVSLMRYSFRLTRLVHTIAMQITKKCERYEQVYIKVFLFYTFLSTVNLGGIALLLTYNSEGIYSSILYCDI